MNNRAQESVPDPVPGLTRDPSVRFVQGNEAVVEGALYAGVSFFAGYPITPSTEIAETLARRLPREGGKFIQMEDEISSLCAVVGASLTGQKAMTATSGPGFSLMQEALGFAVMAEIPCVIVNVMRGGPSTGLPTSPSQADVMQARWGTHGDHAMVALTASNHQDVFAMTVEAVNIAEMYRTPVVLLLDEVVGHMREKLVLPDPGEVPLVERLRTSVPEGTDYHPYLAREDGRLPMSDFGGVHRYNVTGLVHDMWGFPSTKPEVAHALMRHLTDKIESRSNVLARVQEHYLDDDPDILLVAYGVTARTALQVAKNRRSRGDRIGVLELNTLWPFPREAVRRHAARARTVVVLELNMGQVVHEVRKCVEDPDRVFLANSFDGTLMTPSFMRNILRLIHGNGV